MSEIKFDINWKKREEKKIKISVSFMLLFTIIKLLPARRLSRQKTNFLALSRPGEGYSHVRAVRVCAARKPPIFRPRPLLKTPLFRSGPFRKNLLFKNIHLFHISDLNSSKRPWLVIFSSKIPLVFQWGATLKAPHFQWGAAP